MDQIIFNFKDIFRKSFLEGYSTLTLSTKQVVVVLGLTSLIGLYIFFAYRFLTRRTFYSKSFNISLPLVSMITAAIILAVQSSVVISLGMVGALSIVRFRTAIKDPMDLVYLFWAISVGIVGGAGLTTISILLSLAITVMILILECLPLGRLPKLLIINGKSGDELDKEIEEIVKKYAGRYREKSRTVTNGRMDTVIEMMVKDGNAMVRELEKIKGIDSVSLVTHDGEAVL